MDVVSGTLQLQRKMNQRMRRLSQNHNILEKQMLFGLLIDHLLMSQIERLGQNLCEIVQLQRNLNRTLLW